MPKPPRKTTPPSRREKKPRGAAPGPVPLPESLAGEVAELRMALRGWYTANRRRLPWRETPSLYKTVVSEFMLQQTQVAAVLPYFARWLEKFPDFATLAAAPVEEVLRAWEGLGYYRRARLLHELARALVAMKTPPREPAEWLELPGVGPYTAAAITSIAFGAPAAVVDGNVVRVLARLLGVRTEFADGSAAVKMLTPVADALLDPAHPGDHNQGMMELGATVCMRHQPLCTVCPWVQWCEAAARGEADVLPRFTPKERFQSKIQRLWIERDGALLLHRKAGGARRLAGLCELPDAATLPQARLAPKALAVKRRTIVNHTYVEGIFRATLPAGTPDPAEGEGFVWATPEQLARLTLSGPHRRWIGEIRAGG